MSTNWISRAAALFLAIGITASPAALAGPYITVSHVRTAVAPTPPPAPYIATRPLRPTVQHAWVQGQWVWDGYGYAWQTGYWQAPQVIVSVPRVRVGYSAPRYVAPRQTVVTTRQPVITRQPTRRVSYTPARPTTRVAGRPCR